jgi:hypothetical protein
MKNGDLVQSAQSFKGKKGAESHGNKELMPLSDLSPDSPASNGGGRVGGRLKTSCLQVADHDEFWLTKGAAPILQ